MISPPRTRTVLRTLLRDPMARFLAVGIAIFAAYSVMNDAPDTADRDLLVVTDADVARLSDQYRASRMRAPTPDELAQLIDAHVREEVLVREAILLGLDQGDAIIRQRLRQKMEFLTEAAAQTAIPDAAILRGYFDAHSGDYAASPLLSFEQLYLGEGATPEMAERALARLREGTPAQDLGQPTMLPALLSPTPAARVDRDFGAGFSGRIDPGAVGAWQGPVASSFGLHLVRVLAYQPGNAAQFETVRDQVERDWRAQETARLGGETYAALKARYDIRLPMADGPAAQ